MEPETLFLNCAFYINYGDEEYYLNVQSGVIPKQVKYFRIRLFKVHNSQNNCSSSGSYSRLILLHIPNAISCRSVLDQLVENFNTKISAINVYTSSKADFYFMTFTFKSPDIALEFYNLHNKKKIYNSEQTSSYYNKFAFLQDLQLIQADKKSLRAAGNLQALNDNLSFENEDYTEIPSCPVCLERLDESVTGILTIQCNHTFHTECIQKWQDTTCPVCRLEQSPLDCSGNNCSDCDENQSLWLCLICGYIGCSRYLNKHSELHYIETGHLYAIQVGGKKVWDYLADNYVHRIVANSDDGKLVSLQLPHDKLELDPVGTNSIGQRANTDSVKVMNCKMRNMESEFSHLLKVQLTTQREYYEKLMQQNDKKWQSRFDKLEKKLKRKTEEFNEEQILNQHMKKSLAESGKKIAVYQELLKNMKAEYQAKMQELSTQNYDLMLHIAAERSVQEALRSNDSSAISVVLEKTANDFLEVSQSSKLKNRR